MPHINIKLDDIPAEQPLRLVEGNAAIVVLRDHGSVRAYPDRCPHAHWRLSEGEIVDGVLECPGHGWQFQVATGECITVPSYCLKALRVVLCADQVRVEWDEPDPNKESGSEISESQPAVRIAAKA